MTDGEIYSGGCKKVFTGIRPIEKIGGMIYE